MGFFSAIKSFFDPGIDEPWRNAYRQQEAARKAQVQAESQSVSATANLDEEDYGVPFVTEINTAEDAAYTPTNPPVGIYDQTRDIYALYDGFDLE